MNNLLLLHLSAAVAASYYMLKRTLPGPPGGLMQDGAIQGRARTRRRILGYGDSKIAGVRGGNERKAIVRARRAGRATGHHSKALRKRYTSKAAMPKPTRALMASAVACVAKPSRFAKPCC